MIRIFPYLFFILSLLVSCQRHQPTNIPAPDPHVETFTFDQVFMELTLDQSGNPWIRAAKYMKNADPLSSYLPLINTIYRFEGDSLDPVYTDLPNLGSIAFDRKDQLWAITDRSLVRVSPSGIDTVYTGVELISTLLVDLHDNIWITPAGTGIIRINDDGENLYTAELSGILSNIVSCSSVDQANTKWFGHQTSGISRISDIGSVHVMEDFIDQNLYTLTPGSGSNMLAGLGWYNNDTILVRIGTGPPANLSPVLEDAIFPDTKLIVTDIAVDHFSRTWIVISHVENLATVKMELYYHDLDWHKHELLPGEEFIVSLEADSRLGILYVLTNHTLYRIR
jgi:hypothetical protein